MRPGSPADDAGLATGDVILEVNRHPVEDAGNFVNQIHAVPAGKDILLLVWSNGGASYRVVHPGRMRRTACKRNLQRSTIAKLRDAVARTLRL